MVDFGTKYDRLYVAIVTPYKDNTYEVDEGQLRAFLRVFLEPKYIDAGIGIIINPEAGEIYYLNREEKRKNVQIAIDEVKGKVPVFAGIIDNTTDGTVDVAVDAKKLGANGLFAMPPIGAIDITRSWDAVKYPEVWIDMIKQVVKAVGDMPIICHPTDGVTLQFGGGLPVEPTIRMCKEITNIVGWKMTYNYTGYKIIVRALRKFDRHIGILACQALNYHENLACGQFDGTVTGSFNYALEPMMDHIIAWKKGDLKEACRIWDHGLAELQEFIYSDFSRLHVRYKIATWLRGYISNPFMRPPMPRPRKEEVHKICELLVNAGMSIIDKEKVLNLTKSLAL